MKKYIAAIAISIIALGSSMPANAAANVVVAGPGASVAGYATTRVVLTPDAPATLVSTDIAPHDVVSKAKNGKSVGYYFSSATEDIGVQEIKIRSDIPAGDYAFFCSIHPTSMTGVATVL